MSVDDERVQEGPRSQLQWLGCTGYRLRITREDDRDYTIYIDPSLTNPMMPDQLKRRLQNSVIPTDAQAIILTHVNTSILASAVPLALAADDQHCRIYCTEEVAVHIRKTQMIGEQNLVTLNNGFPMDIAEIIRVTSVHSSQRVINPRSPTNIVASFKDDEGTPGAAVSRRVSIKSKSSRTNMSQSQIIIPPHDLKDKRKTLLKNVSSFTGTAAAGWVIQVLNGGPTLYHSGDTNAYTDMTVVDKIYKPTHIIMPIGEATTSSPAAAAYACHNYLKNCHTVIPMLLKSCAAMYGKNSDIQTSADGETFQPYSFCLGYNQPVRQENSELLHYSNSVPRMLVAELE